MTPAGRNLLELNVAVAVISAAPLFAKLIDMDPVSIIGWRALIAVAALGALYTLTRRSARLARPRDYGLFAVLGALMAGHWVTYFQAIQVSTVAIAVVALFTWPVMSALLEPLMHRRAPALRDVALAVVATAGVALVVPEFDPGSATWQGAAWGVLSAFLFVVRNLIQSRWLAAYPGTLSMGYQLLAIAVLLLPFARLPTGDAAVADWALIALLALVFTAAGHSMFVASLAHLSVTAVGLIACLTPVYGIVYAAVILGELPAWTTWLGALLVVGGAMVANLTAARAPGRA